MGDRAAMTGDDNLLAGLDLVQELAETGFRVGQIDRGHGILACDQKTGQIIAKSRRRGYRFVILEIDHSAARRLAEQAMLTVCDASYLWLAQTLGAELVTLDGCLEAAQATLRRS